jgi:hypothetical protein
MVVSLTHTRTENVHELNPIPRANPHTKTAAQQIRPPFSQRRNRYLVVTAVVTVLLIIAGCLIVDRAQGAAATGGLIISEIVSSNSVSLTDTNYGSPDWIELFNGSNNAINLSGYSITNSADSTERFAFGDVNIPAGGYLVIYGAEAISGSNTPCTGFPLSRDGESIFLIDPYDSVVQQINAPKLCTDVSYALSADNNQYGYCLTPSPGAANSMPVNALEDYEKLAQSANLEITEVLPHPSSEDAWIELHNAGTENVSLGLFYLSDSAEDTSPCHLPDNVIGPGEYAVVHTSGCNKALSVPFSLNAGDQGVYLTDISGELRSALTWSALPGIDTAVVAADTYTLTPTPKAANCADVFHLDKQAAMDATDPVHIDEMLMANTHSLPDSDGDHFPWAEVSNTSDTPVSLSGYYLSDDPDNPLKWAFPDITLESNGYALIFLSGKTGQTTGLHASFSLAADENALFLTDSATMRADTFSLPADCETDISVGRTESGDMVYYASPTPCAANADGFTTPSEALESRAGGVLISEVCGTGGDNDWVELFNGSSQSVDLTGWYLSDDTDNPCLWQIPSLQIPAGGYTVIQAGDSSDEAAPFSISASGETVMLTRSDGALVDAMNTGMLRAGITSGRIAGGVSMVRVYFSEPTPGAPNSAQIFPSYTAAPIFSQSKLYCSKPFSLTITAPTQDAAIYYTLDGSAPSDKDTLYTGPISVADSTVVRAIAYSPKLLPSNITTETYLFETPHTVPVVCLAGDPAQMGIVLYKSTRKYKPEYAANVEYYEADGTLGVSFPAGLKAKGRGSLDYPQKSVTIKLRGKYGRSSVTYPFFDTGKVTTFSEITLRNGGQDIYGTLLRDSFFHTLAQGMNVDSVRTKFVVAYVNGEYWGLYSLDEEQEEGYFEAYYGADNDDIDLIDRNETVVEGSNDAFLQVRHDARTLNLADDTVFAEFAKQVDVDACMDYLILNTYFANGDVINQRFWHTRDGVVRWRPLLFDLDWGMRTYSADRDSFHRYFTTSALAGNGSVTYMDIFYGLKKNKAWRNAFIDRFIEMAYTNFDTDHMLSVYDKMIAQMEPEMEREIKRWHTHSSIAAWHAKVKLLRGALEDRREAVLRQMAHAFGLSSSELAARIEAYTSTHDTLRVVAGA